MDAIENKRNHDRLHAFWKVYREDITWGYLIDLSESGLRVWLNKEEDIKDQDFSIRIKPPRELGLENIDFGIQKVWMNPNKSQRFNELGCQFAPLSGTQKQQLEELIVFFKKYNTKEEAVL